MYGLPLIDILIIFAYFIVVIIIGIWAARRIHTQEDFFLGGRSFGKLIQVFAAFGQGTSADSAVGTSTNVFAQGAAGLWGALNLLFATPIYWLTAPWYRRLRLLTLGDFFKERYNSRWMALIYAVIGSVGMMGLVALGIAAMSKTVVALTPKQESELSHVELAEKQLALELYQLEAKDFKLLSDEELARLNELQALQPRVYFTHFSEETLILIMAIVVIVYGAFGGLHAAFLTDLLQGAFIILLSILLLPFAILKVNAKYGGETFADAFRTLHTQLPQAKLEFFGSAIAMDFTWYFILALCVLVTVNVAVQPNQLVAMGSAKDEYTARFGFVVGMLIKRVSTILWGIFALFAILLYSGQLSNPDLVWGYASLDLLAPLGIGLVGLMIACLMSALMSTADALMITSSSLITHNVFNEFWRGRSQHALVWFGRGYGILFIVGSALLAMAFPNIISLMKFLWGFFSVFAAAFWLGLLWRKASRAGAWASIGVSGLLFLVLPSLLPALFPAMRTDAALLVKTHDRIVERSYIASAGDVQESAARQQAWGQQDPALRTGQAQPARIVEGQAFVQSFQIPGKSVFWTEDIANRDGTFVGAGQFNLDLWILNQLGWDLPAKVYAFNETIKMWLRILLPFGTLLLVSLLLPQKQTGPLNRFFIKMRTPALADPQADIRRLEAAYANPQSTDSKLLFPNSGLEIFKPDRVTVIGFVLSSAAVLLLLAFIAWITNPNFPW